MICAAFANAATFDAITTSFFFARSLTDYFRLFSIFTIHFPE